MVADRRPRAGWRQGAAAAAAGSAAHWGAMAAQAGLKGCCRLGCGIGSAWGGLEAAVRSQGHTLLACTRLWVHTVRTSVLQMRLNSGLALLGPVCRQRPAAGSMPMQGVQRAPRMHFAPCIASAIPTQCQERCKHAGLHAPLARSLLRAPDALQQLWQRTALDSDLVEARRRSSGKLPPASRRRRRRSPAASCRLLLRTPSAAHALPYVAACSAAPSSRSSGSSSSMSKAQLLEDIFEVLEKDPDGKKFDKGGQRCTCCWRLDGYSILQACSSCCCHSWQAKLHPASFPRPCVSRLAPCAHTPLPHRPVSRIKARSDLYEMDLTLDVNTDVYPGADSRRRRASVRCSRPPLQQA